VLDPFSGSGTTLEAAFHEGFNAIGIEAEAEYFHDIQRRLAERCHSAAAPIEPRSAAKPTATKPVSAGPLFDL